MAGHPAVADCIIIDVKEADLDSPARGNLLSVVLPTVSYTHLTLPTIYSV